MSSEKSKIRILLIDHDEVTRIYFRDIFWIHGHSDIYEIEMAASLREAEEKIKAEKPNIIFLDILIPEDGEENKVEDQMNRSSSFIKKIKNSKELSDIKIIIYSNQKEKIIKDEFCKLGVDGYLIKEELMPKEIISFVSKLYE